MNIIITENKLKRLSLTWLNDRVGPLTGREVEKLPGYYQYRYKNLEDSMPIFDYDTRKGKNIIYFKDWELLSLLRNYFPWNDEESIELITRWIEEIYNLDIKRMDFDSFMSFRHERI